VNDMLNRQKKFDGDPEEITVGFFVTCIVDLLRPSVGFASIRLIEDAGCSVSVPQAQACCGQPAYNIGDKVSSMVIARQVISVFEQFDYVVIPSGSCAGMIREHYPRLFTSDLVWLERARRLSEKTYELTEFLVDVMEMDDVHSTQTEICTYHDSCSGFRELGVQRQPRQLLSTINGLEIKEMKEATECCGFGGLFCVKYPEISTHIVANKVENIVDTKADILLGGDLGCLMNIAGYMRRRGTMMRVFHVAEVLAAMTDKPGICDKEQTQDV